MSTMTPRSDLRRVVAVYALSRFTNPVKLTTGIESYDYIDASKVLCTPELQGRVGAAVAEALVELEIEDFDVIGGIELGGILVAQAYILHAIGTGPKVPDSIFVRKNGLVEGAEVDGLDVVIVEDVVTTGASTIVAVDAALDCGGRVIGVVSLVDRGDNLQPQLEGHGIPYKAITTYVDYGIQPIQIDA